MKTYGIWLLVPLLLSACDNPPAKLSPASGHPSPHGAELQTLLRQVKNNLVFAGKLSADVGLVK